MKKLILGRLIHSLGGAPSLKGQRKGLNTGLSKHERCVLSPRPDASPERSRLMMGQHQKRRKQTVWELRGSCVMAPNDQAPEKWPRNRVPDSVDSGQEIPGGIPKR